MKGQRWIVDAMTFLLFGFLLFELIKTAVLMPTISKELNLKLYQTGLLLGIFSGGPGIVMGFIGGSVVDKIGARYGGLFPLIAFTVVTIGVGLSSTYLELASAIIIFGVFESFTNTVVYKLTGNWFGQHERGLIEELTNRGKIVFTSNDILRYSVISENSVPKYGYRLKGYHNVYKIERNKFSLTDDPFIVASQVISPAYISFNSALYINNLLSQTINTIEIATPIRKKDIIFQSMLIRFIHINPDLMFGYKKILKENSYILLADVEKIIIDILYRPDISPISNIVNIPASKINKSRLKEYVRSINIEAVRRRLGYIMNYKGININIKMNNSSIYKLNPYNKNKGRYVPEWKLFDNEVDY